METKTTTWLEFANGEKAIVQLAPEEINTKEQDCESHSKWFK